jgi:hypothetical protein
MDVARTSIRCVDGEKRSPVRSLPQQPFLRNFHPNIQAFSGHDASRCSSKPSYQISSIETSEPSSRNYKTKGLL